MAEMKEERVMETGRRTGGGGGEGRKRGVGGRGAEEGGGGEGEWERGGGRGERGEGGKFLLIDTTHVILQLTFYPFYTVAQKNIVLDSNLFVLMTF